MGIQFNNYALLSPERYLYDFGAFAGIGSLFDQWSTDPVRYQEQMVAYFGFNPFTNASALDPYLEQQIIGDILNGVLTATKFSSVSATTITLDFVPSYLQPGNLVYDTTAAYSPISHGTLIQSIAGAVITLNGALVASFVGSPSGSQPSSTVLQFAANTENLGLIRVGAGIIDGNSNIPSNGELATTFITAIKVVGATTYVTLSQPTTGPVDGGDTVIVGGVLAGDQISFSPSTLTTNAETLEGSSVLHFGIVPPAILPGTSVLDDHSPSRLVPYVQIVSKTPTTITLASPALGNIPHGSEMTFIATP